MQHALNWNYSQTIHLYKENEWIRVSNRVTYFFWTINIIFNMLKIIGKIFTKGIAVNLRLQIFSSHTEKLYSRHQFMSIIKLFKWDVSKHAYTFDINKPNFYILHKDLKYYTCIKCVIFHHWECLGNTPNDKWMCNITSGRNCQHWLHLFVCKEEEKKGHRILKSILRFI